MINMKAMTTLQKIGRGFREIHRLEPQLIPLTLTSGVTKAALPFVNLYFSSRDHRYSFHHTGDENPEPIRCPGAGDQSVPVHYLPHAGEPLLYVARPSL